MIVDQLKILRSCADRCVHCNKMLCVEKGKGGFCDNIPVTQREILRIIDELITYKEREKIEKSNVIH